LVKEILAAGGYTTVNTLGSGFNFPLGVAVDGSGNVFVADYGHNSVKELLAAGGYATMRSLGSGFMSPFGVSLDGNGNVFVTDASQNTVKEILAAGDYTTVNTLANSGFSYPEGVAVDGSGNVYVADWDHTRLVMLDYADAPSLTFATPTNVGATDTTDGPQTVTIQNIGNAALTFQPSVAGDLSNAVLTGSTVSDCSALAGLQLPQGGQCTLGIEFVPSAAGPLTGFVNVVDNALNAAATQTITLTGNGIAQTLDHFTVTGLAGAVAGVQQSVTVTAEDVTNHTDTGYTGTVHFTSTDPQAVLPADYAFVASERGSHNFSVTLESVGSQTLTATDTASSANGTSAAVAISGATATLGVSPSAVTVTYGKVGSIAVTVTGQAGLAQPSGNVSYTIGTGSAQLAAIVSGSATVPLPSTLLAAAYTVTISYGGDSTYAPATPINVSLTVTPAAVTVTADAKSKVYGSSDPALTYQPFGLVNGDQLSGNLMRAVGEMVGPYAILQGTLTAGGNYTINYTPASLTITRANASVTPNPATKVYGTVDPALGGTLSGFLAADGVTATYARTAGENVAGSPYTISATLNPTGVLANYNITYNTANFTITQASQAPVTVAAPASASYGQIGLSVSAAGGSGTGAYNCSAGASTACSVGSITGALTISSGTGTCSITAIRGADANYSASAASAAATITITKATSVISWVTPAAVAYGTTLSSAQLNATANTPGTFVYAPEAGTTPATGVDTLSVTFTPTDIADYTTANQTVLLTVNKDATTATISVANSATYGSSITLTATISPATSTGTVTFRSGSTTLGTSTISNGTASLTLAVTTTNGFTVGTDSITAVYGGDSNDSGSTSSAAALAVTESTTTSGTVSPSSIALGSSSTMQSLTATVTATSGTPAGTVTFKVGNVTVGSAPLSNGIATLSIAPTTANGFTVGSDTVTASYVPVTGSGFIASSATQTMTVTAPAYTITPGSISVSLSKGGSQTITVNLASATFADIVTLTVSSSSSLVAASLSSTTVQLAQNGTGSVTLNITASNSAANHVPSLPWTGGLIAFGAVLAGVPLVRGRKRFAAVLLAALAITMLGLLMSCGGGGGTSTPPPRSYTVTISGTGGISSTIAVTVE
jgi:hypothetical protein